MLGLRASNAPAVLRMHLIGANPAPNVAGLDELPGKTNYFIGANPSDWHTDVPSYSKVAYRDLYPGIDLVYYGNQGRLEYDFVLAPGADPADIRVAFEGAVEITLDAQGNLFLHMESGHVVLNAPVIYQELGGARLPVSGGYVLSYSATGDSTNEIRFQVYATYLGSSSFDNGNGIVVNGSGEAYVAGASSSTNFPTQGPIQATAGGSFDAFVAKLNAAGSALVFSTYLGGSGFDQALAIAIDGTGNAYVTGEVRSTNFPTASPFQASSGGGFADAFVAKIDATEHTLVNSSYLGGSDIETARGIAADSSGNAYVTGNTLSIIKQYSDSYTVDQLN